jgi:hypothetical protein
MDFKTAEAQDTYDRVDTIHWVAHVAMLTMDRYRQILSDSGAFSAVFPGVSFDNPKISHTVEGHGILLTTSKKEILATQNHELFKAWQIVLAITGMTSILEYYLKQVAERISGTTCKAMGILERFKKKTRIPITQFENYKNLRHFCQVRNISVHNLGRMNQIFRDKTCEHNHDDGPYVFYPSQVTKYRDLIKSLIHFIETRLPA